MIIDLTKLVTNSVEELNIEQTFDIEDGVLATTTIRELKDTVFCGKVIKLCDNSYQISGTIKGIMVLPDDITLKDVDYSFESYVEEKFGDNLEVSESSLQIVQNRLDIRDFLWQNILVEIPLKVVDEESRNLNLKGNGWRLVTEEELNRCNDSPFSELSKMFDSRKE